MSTFNYKPVDAVVALADENYYLWDTSVIKADNKYYMFSSRWPKALDFGYNWLFNSEIILSMSEKPEGPYKFLKVVLPRRGSNYFDGMNTHNTCIRFFDNKYYLYYMGTTFKEGLEKDLSSLSSDQIDDVWNHKRIGLAVADKIDGEYERKDEPLLLPREDNWDKTAITNPAVAILPSGETYMIYKSRPNSHSSLQLGISHADNPNGQYKRLLDEPILQFDDNDIYVEDPFLWYDANKKKFCAIIKDDTKNGKYGITGEWGAGFYTESDDCINFKIEKDCKVYSRTIQWKDGHVSTQGNLERPCLLFDENGKPTHIFFASGDGDAPYAFKGLTYIICMKLVEK